MKNYFFSFIFTITHLQFAVCQELVNNGDFEEYTRCVSGYGELDVSTGWFQASGSADYYNSCNRKKNSVSVPDNYCGSQRAHSGKGYAGLYLFGCNKLDEKGGFYDREYIHTKLVSPLEKDIIYSVSFYYSLAEKSQYYTNKVGISLSKNGALQKAKPTSTCLVSDHSVAQAIPRIDATDTINWHKIEFQVTSKGGEEYLVIGLFEADLLPSEFKRLVKKRMETSDKNESSCYYYVDDVSIVKMDEGTDFSLKRKK